MIARLAAPLATGGAAFLLYTGTAARTHRFDAPVYAREVVEGAWVSLHHLLPRLVGGVAVALVEGVGPGTEAYGVLVALSAAAGAASVALLHAWLRAEGVRGPVAAAAALLFAVARGPWSLATTWELALFPLAAVLAGLLVSTGRGPAGRAGVAVGLWAAIGGAFHLLALGAWPALALAVAAGRPPREAARAVAAMAGTATIGLFCAYEGVLRAIGPAATGSRAFAAAAVLTAPTLDDLRGKPRPPDALAFAFDAAVAAVPGPGAALLLAAAILAALAAGALRARHGARLAVPLVAIAGAAFVAWRVEPPNWEYQVLPVAMVVAAAAAALDARGTDGRRAAFAIVAAAVALIAVNHGEIRRSMGDGPHRGVVFEGRTRRPIDAWGRPVGR